jgi:transcriptional regulator GlxA family with amidase domain
MEHPSGRGWSAFAIAAPAAAPRGHVCRYALADAPEPPPELAWAWGRMVASGGRVPVRRLAETTGWSERRLLRGFREHVGLPPKTFARLLRFRRAVARLEREGARALADVALDCGYYDQAHFNRDFRAFAGATPTEFRTAA